MTAVGYEKAGNNIRSHFKTQAAAIAGTGQAMNGVGIAYDNDKGDVPGATATKWCRLTILDGDSQQADMASNPFYRHFGVVDVSIFVKPQQGDASARSLHDALAGFFRGQRVQGIVFRAPITVNSGGLDGAGWWKRQFQVPFYWDETY